MDDNSQRGENQSFEYYQARVKRSEIHLIPTKSHFSTSLLNGWFDSNNDGVICESVEIRRSYVSWGGRVAISAFGMRCCCGYLFLPSITWNSKYRQAARQDDDSLPAQFRSINICFTGSCSYFFNRGVFFAKPDLQRTYLRLRVKVPDRKLN